MLLIEPVIKSAVVCYDKVTVVTVWFLWKRHVKSTILGQFIFKEQPYVKRHLTLNRQRLHKTVLIFSSTCSKMKKQGGIHVTSLNFIHSLSFSDCSELSFGCWWRKRLIRSQFFFDSTTIWCNYENGIIPMKKLSWINMH